MKVSLRWKKMEFMKNSSEKYCFIHKFIDVMLNERQWLRFDDADKKWTLNTRWPESTRFHSQSAFKSNPKILKSECFVEMIQVLHLH